MRLVVRIALGALAFCAAVVTGAYLATVTEPIVIERSIGLPDWPRGAAPIRVALLADIHIGNASMGPNRLHRIVDQVNALRPDVVVIAGDFLAGYDKPAALSRSVQLATELARLSAPLGVVAVLGNHDMATEPHTLARGLRNAGIVVLQNTAVQRGPLVIGGLGDGYSGNAQVEPMVRAMAPLHGARIVLTHSPASVPLLPRDISLALTGHTHCGQITLPFSGPLTLPSVPARYACGLVTEGSRRTVISGGLGTSTLPFRIGAPPDLWVLTLGPEPEAKH